MAYIGNTPISVAFLTDTFNGNGSATAFTMTVAPANTSSILVAITGVVQDPSTYSVAGTTLTFSAAPPSGTSNISVRYLGIPASGVTTTAYRTVTDFTATAGQTTFSVPSYTVGYIDVYRNGVRLGAADYTATSGTTVVLVNAATAGDLVVTESFYVSSVLNAIPASPSSVGTSYLVDASVTAAKLATGAVGNTQMAAGAARANWGAGGVLQVVSVTKTDSFSSSSGSFVDITGLSVAITPSSTSSKILVMATVAVGNSINNAQINLVRNGTNISQSTSGTANNTVAMDFPSSYKLITYPIMYLDSPATTSAVTYKIQFNPNSSTAYINVRGTDSYFGGTSSITLMEIAA